MMEEDVPGELGLAIATTFSVATDDDVDGHEIVVKQEPPDMLLPPEVIEHEHEDEHANEDDDDDDRMFEDEAQVFPEDSDIVMQRAVSPPTYVDPTEERFQELALYYKEKFQLPDVTVALENCDKIWNTMQMIKNLQECTKEEDSSDVLPKTSSTSEEPKLIPYQPSLGNDNKALPDFRFSVKSKRKLYHCVTCGKEFLDNNHLHQHAMQEHGIYVNPKRIYKPRADMIAKVVSPLAASSGKVQINETVSPVALRPQIQTIIPVHAMQAVETMQQSIEPMITDNDMVPSTPIVNEVKTEESQVKEVKGNLGPVKEKIKCVLCKRLSTNIVSHMRNYHKVGCLSSIITQCEKVVDPPPNSSAEEIAPEESESVNVPEAAPVDKNESLPTTVRKRKRNHPRWTIHKKKKYSSLPVQNFNNGPFQCLVCLGLYKTTKSFSYHKKLHRMRGETPENFDPSKCRFLNSPLRLAKGTQSSAEAIANPVSIHKEPSKLQKAITDYMAMPREVAKPDLVNEDTNNSESSSLDVDNDNPSERPTCECGRSFRSSYTMFLHKAKCKKPMKSSNDADSGLGISIKIKKNKNDSYEVVPRNTPTEECYKGPSKDSDASSNDSGMASVDLNNQRVDASDPSQFNNENHTVLKIRAAEDDEEVDIEDDNSNHSNLNNVIESQIPRDPVILDTAENDALSVKDSTKNHSSVPTLRSLCQKVLATSTKQQEQDLPIYRCETCKTYFQTKTEVMDHAKKLNHDPKSHCPCGKDFKNLKYYNVHVRRFHPTLLKCSYCSTSYDRIEKSLEHECSVTEGPAFIEPIIQTTCLQCKTLVDLGESFDKHMKTHMVDSTLVYHCFKCDLKFDNSHLRRMHFDSKHGFSLCRVCGKLLHIDHIYEHEAYHDGLGHPCHKCRKTFSLKAQLKRHIQNTHEPHVNKVIKCMVCSKSLKLKNLKKHVSVHLHTEICRKCNKCFKSYDEEKNLEDHITSDHPTDYPTLTCDTCNAAFISDERYKEHCQNGSCKSDLNNKLTLVQNATSN
ncbi:uncharacterized protein LOC100679531 isoform X1 [Nasonia vitripennis]|uniref:C2H2-type domain-containing protein n=2 Tax=Nasonia vitripennis TaxID=7425 RepID=A0A7M7GDL1_NASVI|nr:uncharacterized protein LOC100679531 isoform X1 [Nasonia vitripennis]